MKINEMDFMKLLPAFMQEDDAVNGLADGVNKVTEELAAKIKLFTTWNQIDYMSSEELDLLADELHISWYDKNSNLDVKRSLIKNSDLVHAKMGTNWAVQNVIETYFGSGSIEDWYNYDGQPYHFKVITTNEDVTTDSAEKFMRVLDKVKRKSAWLDGIEVVSDSNCTINVFLLSAETETITTNIIFFGSHNTFSDLTYNQMNQYTHDELGGI